MRKLLFIFLFFLFIYPIFADNKSVYLELLKKNKLPELFEHLQKWEKSEPQNPEVYIGYFNYYLRKGSKSGVDIKKYNKSNDESLAITDPKTGKIKGYLTNTTFYDFNEINHAFEYIDKGLKLSPNRLDMHFGKIYLLNEIEDYEKAIKATIRILEISVENKNNWLWSDNKYISDGEKFLLKNIQDYYKKWLDDMTDRSLEAIRIVSLEQIKLYPSNDYGYSSLGAYYAIKEQYNEALKYFLQAEKIYRNDSMLLNNIAICYEAINNKEMAKKYYEKIIIIGDSDYVEYAKKMLSELK